MDVTSAINSLGNDYVAIPSDGQVLVLDALRLEAGVYQADFEFLEVPELRHVGLIVHFETLLQKCEKPERSVTLRPFKVMRFVFKMLHSRIECGAWSWWGDSNT